MLRDAAQAVCRLTQSFAVDFEFEFERLAVSVQSGGIFRGINLLNSL